MTDVKRKPYRRDNAATRRVTAFEMLKLRTDGMTTMDIAGRFGVSRNTVLSRIREALDADMPEAVEAYRAVQNDQLDALTRTLMPLAMNGDLNAVDRMLKVMVRRAALNAMDLTPTINVNATLDVTAVGVMPTGLAADLEAVSDRLALEA